MGARVVSGPVGARDARPTGAAADRPHYPALDGLRAVAVLILFFQHTGYSTGLQFRDGFRWMGHMEIGPTTFFVLSAFLLYQPFVAAQLAGRRGPSAGSFWSGRALRVLPLYWVSLALLVSFFRADSVTGAVDGMKVDGWQGALALFTFTQIYVPEWFFHGIPQAYTLNVEVAFYIFLPVFAFVVARACRGRALGDQVRVQLVALAGVALFALAWRLGIHTLFEDDLRRCVDADSATVACAAKQWLPGYLDYFALGMAIAVVASWCRLRGAEPGWLQRLGRMPDVLFVVAFALWLLYSTQLGTDPGLGQYIGPGRAEARHYLNALIVVCALLPGVFGPRERGLWRRFLAWRPIAFLGLVSYGIYLWHQGWTDKALQWTDIESVPWRFAVVTSIAALLAIATATVGWYLIERPVQRRRRSRAATVPAP